MPLPRVQAGPPHLPCGEARPSGVRVAAVHPRLHVALAGGPLGERLLTHKLGRVHARAAASHAGHHGVARGVSPRAHGVAKNLGKGGAQEKQSEDRIMDVFRAPASGEARPFPSAPPSPAGGNSSREMEVGLPSSLFRHCSRALNSSPMLWIERAKLFPVQGKALLATFPEQEHLQVGTLSCRPTVGTHL